MPSEKELAVLRKQTSQYILDNPTDIILQRATKVRDGAGGWRVTRAPLGSPQTFRIVQAAENEGVERRNSDGEVVRPTLNMLAVYNADLQEGDQFTYHGGTAEVVYITDMRYELVAEVAMR